MKKSNFKLFLLIPLYGFLVPSICLADSPGNKKTLTPGERAVIFSKSLGLAAVSAGSGYVIYKMLADCKRRASMRSARELYETITKREGLPAEEFVTDPGQSYQKWMVQPFYIGASIALVYVNLIKFRIPQKAWAYMKEALMNGK